MSKPQVRMFRFKDEHSAGHWNASKNTLYKLVHLLHPHSIYYLTDNLDTQIEVHSDRLEELPDCPEVYVGDKFTLLTDDHTYTYYQALLDSLGFGTFRPTTFGEGVGEVFTVVTVARHLVQPRNVVIGASDKYPGKLLIVGFEGIRLHTPTSPDTPAEEGILVLVESAKKLKGELADLEQFYRATKKQEESIKQQLDNIETKLAEHGLALKI